MTTARMDWVMLPLLVVALAGCAAGGMQAGSTTNLSAAQCRDLTDIRNKAPVTRERNMSELAALRRAGYQPEWFDDPYYPEDLQAAQRQVNFWYQTECPQAKSS
jgi:Domain of unknown function (DUF4148)